MRVEFDEDDVTIKTMDMESVPRVGEYVFITDKGLKMYKVLDVSWTICDVLKNHVVIDIKEVGNE